nr:MAG TPA: hypothetical protein [Caudoviricetes sp.]
MLYIYFTYPHTPLYKKAKMLYVTPLKNFFFRFFTVYFVALSYHALGSIFMQEYS